MFRKIIGQDKALAILINAIKNERIASSYLFYGPDGVGKFTTALYFGMAINCLSISETRPCGICNSCLKFLEFSHPDFIYVFPTPKLDITENGEIKASKVLEEYNQFLTNKKKTPWREFFFSGPLGIRIDSIRYIEHKISLSANEANRKIYIIEDAHEMTTQAANAFLKTLEEPPADTIIILTTSKPNSLLPTIISRCQQIQFQPIPHSLIETWLKDVKFLSEAEARICGCIANGSLEKALRLAEDTDVHSRRMTDDLIDMIIRKDDLSFLNMIGQFRSKSQSLLGEIISHLIIWISDVLYYHTYPQEIINLDKPETLKKLYQLCPQIVDLAPETIFYLEDIKKKLENYVNPELVIIDIYHKLTKLFQGE